MIDEVAPPRLPRLAGDTLAYGLGSAATATVSIIAVPILTRLLDPASYGTLDLFTTLLSILTLLAQLGLSSSLVYFYRRAEHASERADVAASALAAMTGTSAGLGALGAVVFVVVSAGAGQPALVTVTGMLTFLWLPVNVIGSAALDVLRSQFRARTFAVLNVARAALATLLGVVLVAAFRLDMAGVVGAQVVVGAGFALVSLWAAGPDVTVRPRWPTVRRLLRFGLPLVPAGISAWVLIFSNRYFLLQFRSLEEIGVYAVANRVAAVLTIATVAINAAWVPFAVHETRMPAHRSTFARIVALTVAGLSVAAVALGLFSREAVAIAAPGPYQEAAGYVGLLALAAAAGTVGGMLAIGLQLAERTTAVAAAAGIAALASVALNLCLVPAWGALGAAVSTLATLTLQAAVTLYLAQRHYRVPYRTGAIGATFAGALASIVLGRIVVGIVDPVPGLLARLVIFAAFCAATAFITRRAIRSVE